MDFSISLRGETYAAERFSKTAYIALANLIRDKKGNFISPDSPQNKQALAEIITDRLTDDLYIKRLSYWLLLVFPSLPRNLVWYGDENYSVPFGIALEPEEIMNITSACSKAMPTEVVDTKLIKNNAPKLHSSKNGAGFSPRMK